MVVGRKPEQAFRTDLAFELGAAGHENVKVLWTNPDRHMTTKRVSPEMDGPDNRNDSPLDPSSAPSPRRLASIAPDVKSTSKRFTSFRSTTIELLSTTATSSAFPESFGLQISSRGRWTVAYSSSALYVLSTQHLPQLRCRAFRLRRKPVSAAITEKGRLAVLTTPHKVDVYQFGEETELSFLGPISKVATVWLDVDAKVVALTEDGELVATGSDGSVEIKYLGVGTGGEALEKRQIHCGSLDHIVFSADGRTLLLTAAARRARTSTSISINSIFEDAMFEDAQAELDPVGKLWVSRLLFPEKIQARQVAFLPNINTGHVDNILGFNTNNDRFGVFDVGLKSFTGKILGTPEGFRLDRSERFCDCLPAFTSDGSHVAVALQLNGRLEVWTYFLEPDWVEDQEDDIEVGEEAGSGRPKSRPSLLLSLPPREEGKPIETLSSLKWMDDSGGQATSSRLAILISTAAQSMPEDVVPSAAPAASGKLIVYDFQTGSNLDNSLQASSNQLMIDLDIIQDIEELAVGELALDQEVDFVRRRTTKMQKKPENGVYRQNSMERRRSLSSGHLGRNSGLLGLHSLAGSDSSDRIRRRRSMSSLSSRSEDAETGSPALVATDEPYVQFQPRSQFSIQRAATVSANSMALRSHLRALPHQPLEYRRADGLREIPHESDADNWVPPPPPYSAKPEDSLEREASIPDNRVTSISSIDLAAHITAQTTSRLTPIPRLPITVSPPTARQSPTRESAPTAPRFAPLATQTTVAPITSAISRRPISTAPIRPIPNVSMYSGRQPSPSTCVQRNATYPPPNLPHISPTTSTPPPAGELYEDLDQPLSASALPDPTSIAQFPTAEQLNSLHRRSMSGNSDRRSIPKAAVGARASSDVRRAIVNGSPGRAQSYPSPADALNILVVDQRRDPTIVSSTAVQPSPAQPSTPTSRARPPITRLATIASVVSATEDADTRSMNRVTSLERPQAGQTSELHHIYEATSSRPGTQDMSSAAQPTQPSSSAFVARRKSWWKKSGPGTPLGMTVNPRLSQLSLPTLLDSATATENLYVDKGSHENAVTGVQRRKSKAWAPMPSFGDRRFSADARPSESGRKKGGDSERQDKGGGGRCVVM